MGPPTEGSLLTWKRTLAALAVLAALVAVGYFVEVRWDQARMEREEREARPFPFGPKEVVAFVVETPEAAFRLERTDPEAAGRGAGWSLVSPVRAPANPVAVGAFLWQVQAMRILERLPEGPAASYGLGPPEGHALTAVGPAGREVRVEVGREVPTRPAVYARAGEGPVVLVDRSALLALDVDLGRLRDRRLVVYPPQSVVRMTWERPDPWGLLAAVKDPSVRSGWSLEAPVAAPADPERAEKVAADLLRVGALEVAAEREEAEGRLADFGLDPPRVRARIETKGGEVHEVSFGALVPVEGPAPEPGETPPYHVYALNDSGAVFVVKGDLLRKVNAPAVEWRDRRLARVARWEIRRMEVHGSVEREHWVLERGDDRTWWSPQVPDRPFGWQEIDPHLDNFLGLRFVAFLDEEQAAAADLGLEKPYLRVDLTDDRGETWYEIGARFPNNPALRYARVEGRETGLILFGGGVKALREIYYFFRELEEE